MNWHFYDPETGLLSGRTFSGPAGFLDANTPPGLAAIEGELDHLSQRIDVTVAPHVVVDFRPPKPNDDHEWNAQTKRWQKKPEVAAREARAQAAKHRIDELERRQARRVRELLKDDPRMAAIEVEIASLRAQL